MQHCSMLKEYAQYVARVRHYASDMPLNQAVKRAVDECIREGILAEFLARNRNEVISMSIFEYDKELEEKKLRKAEYEYGFAEGEKHAAIEIAKRMLKTNNFSLEEIAAFSGVSLDDVKFSKPINSIAYRGHADSCRPSLFPLGCPGDDTSVSTSCFSRK